MIYQPDVRFFRRILRLASPKVVVPRLVLAINQTLVTVLWSSGNYYVCICKLFTANTCAGGQCKPPNMQMSMHRFKFNSRRACPRVREVWKQHDLPPKNATTSTITVRCVEWVRIGYAAIVTKSPPRPPRQDKLFPSPCSYLATSSLNLIINLNKSKLNFEVKRMAAMLMLQNISFATFLASTTNLNTHPFPQGPGTTRPVKQLQSLTPQHIILCNKMGREVI